MKTICNLDVPVDSKAPKPSSQTEKVPQGKKPGAKSGVRRKQSSKHTSESKTEASKSKTGQLEKDTQCSSARDKSPSHPLPPTPVVGEMHKEAQQAAGGPTSLGATSKEGAHPQLSSGHEASANSIGSNLSVLADKTKSARDGLETTHTDSGATEKFRADDISLKVMLEDLSGILKDTRYASFTPESLTDEPIIVSNGSKEEEGLAKLKNIYWELPLEFLNLPSQVSLVEEKLKILDSLPSLLHKVTDTLNRFATMVENASRATSMNVPSAGKVIASPTEVEKNTKDDDTNLKDELVDLLGKNVMT
ncbi:hypothetical protein Tco_1031150 [Tanacetum coccineum]|uniref:Uncharacterized protein n=1 Tax=Tanacetum coccineum TaxID=301880 RepID=A0ABQ5G902_9ASTR